MSLTFLSADPDPIHTVACAICESLVPIATATAGLADATGNQAFACDDHFYHGHEFITGWADFNIKRQDELLDRSELTPSGVPAEEWGSDWTLY